MKKTVWMVLLVLGLALDCVAGKLQDKFFYAGCNLGNKGAIDNLIATVKLAKKCGFNGMVWQSDIQYAWMLSPHEMRNLERLKAACDEAGIDIIPAVWSIGYGAMLHANPNLAEGLPVFDVPYTVSADGKTAVFDAPPPYAFPNGGFEDVKWSADHKSFKLPGWNYVDDPGKVSFIDENVKHSGAYSIRYELANTSRTSDPHARACRVINVKPNRRYRVTAWIKTEDLDTTSGFQITIYTTPLPGEKEGFTRQLTMNRPKISKTGDWVKMNAEISTLHYTKLMLYLGSWSARQGRFWVDDVELEETGFPNMLRRPGCPLTVVDAESGKPFEAGKDYVDIPPLKAGQEKVQKVNNSLVLDIVPGGKLKPGAKLLLSGYRSHLMKQDSQVTVCMSEPELYKLFEKSAVSINKLLHPKKWFLPMDEIRTGGTCAACKARDIDMAHRLGECVSKQVAIIRKVSPKAPIFIWGDQFDPNMNARDGVCMCQGTFAGSHKLIPKNDLVIMHWGGSIQKSMDFFAENGFVMARSRSIDGGWDEKRKAMLREDFKAAMAYPSCRGYMYTTWTRDYTPEKMEFFGELFKTMKK